MSHLFLCTLELVCARDKTVLTRLRVEMRRETSMARNGRLYRKVRISREDAAGPDEGYDYSAAFAEEGDQIADGAKRELTLTVRIGDGPATSRWMKHEYRVKVRRNGVHRLEILAVAPVVDTPEPEPRVEQPRPERPRREDPFAGFWNFGPKFATAQTTTNPVWVEIQAVLMRKRFTSAGDVARARKAMALLLHDDRSPAGQEMDALARANAYLDQCELPFKQPLSA
jgi:hypothetical protein